ncbi:MAG: SDR family oxidoreductase [Candidatus Dojkabacteria bacterium]|nr:MAG: SDR family oxidoreductase [Candidatus Dojkabacteria bacterium]
MTNRNVVLVTGVSSGFGYLIAKTFASHGWLVYGTVRTIKSVAATELAEQGVHLITLDVTDKKAIHAGITKISQEQGRLDVLVNNAGVGYIGATEEFSAEEIREQFEVNVFGVHEVTRLALPLLKQSQGKIIMMSSLAARSTAPLYGVYSATKQALHALSDALAFELAPFGVSVLQVEPGSFATNFGKNMKYPQSYTKESPYQKLYAKYLGFRKNLDARLPWLDRMRNPQKVADLVVRIAYLEQPRQRYTVGFGSKLALLSVALLPATFRHRIFRWWYGW